MTIEIGIDVGWSSNSRSCAVAVRGHQPDWANVGEQRAENYANSAITVKRFTLHELVDWLPAFLDQPAIHLAETTLIVDGPLELNARPTRNRYIDAACRTQGFYGRAFPNDVEGRNGQEYVNATYGIVDPFLASGRTQPWLGDSSRDGLIVAETHPTVGLAMLLPMLDPQTDIPSRRRPIRVSDRFVRAKSDWYWMRGAGEIVGKILDGNDIAAERDHERRAALFCVAVAKRLADGLAFALGRATAHENGKGPGVYIIPAEIHSDWWADVRRIGIMAIGQPRDGTRLISIAYNEAPPLGVAEGDHDQEGGGQFQDAPPYGAQDLYLCDNGGFWEAHNPWLAGYDDGVIVEAFDGQGEVIHLWRAGGAGQWTSEQHTLPLPLARARGFQGQHLSLDTCVIIPVRVE